MQALFGNIGYAGMLGFCVGVVSVLAAMVRFTLCSLNDLFYDLMLEFHFAHFNQVVSTNFEFSI